MFVNLHYRLFLKLFKNWRKYIVTKKKNLGKSGSNLESRSSKLARDLFELRKFRWKLRQYVNLPTGKHVKDEEEGAKVA